MLRQIQEITKQRFLLTEKKTFNGLPYEELYALLNLRN